MTNPTHPDMMYKCINARHEDIRNAEAARHAAKQAQAEQGSRAKDLLNSVVSFAKGLHSQSAQAIETSEVPQIQLGNEQAG